MYDYDSQKHSQRHRRLRSIHVLINTTPATSVEVANGNDLKWILLHSPPNTCILYLIFHLITIYMLIRDDTQLLTSVDSSASIGAQLFL